MTGAIADGSPSGVHRNSTLAYTSGNAGAVQCRAGLIKRPGERRMETGLQEMPQRVDLDVGVPLS
jgi:hypothetical protein